MSIAGGAGLSVAIYEVSVTECVEGQNRDVFEVNFVLCVKMEVATKTSLIMFFFELKGMFFDCHKRV